MIAPSCGLRRRAFRTAAGGAKNRSSYGGIFAFQSLHCEIGHLFRSREPRSLNPGGRQIFDAGDDDVYLCVLWKSHGFGQFDFATLNDCLVGENLHPIQLSPARLESRRSWIGMGEAIKGRIAEAAKAIRKGRAARSFIRSWPCVQGRRPTRRSWRWPCSGPTAVRRSRSVRDCDGPAKFDRKHAAEGACCRCGTGIHMRAHIAHVMTTERTLNPR